MYGVTVLHTADPQCVGYSLHPLRASTRSKLFAFTMDAEHCLFHDRNPYLLIVRYFKERYARVDDNLELLGRFRDRYRKVILFDDSDGADSMHFELIDHVDAYYKRQLLKDRSHYLRPMYRGQLFSDYYHRTYGVLDEREWIRRPAASASSLAKLKVAWNLGLGDYQRRVEPVSAANTDHSGFIQARFDYQAYPASIGYQRRLFLRKIRNKPGFRTDYVDRDMYQRELSAAAAVLSPFGYGEICHRDFEAIVAGALLLKPSMDHLETWPDVYVPNETYVSVDWDGENLLSTGHAILSGQTPTSEIARHASEVYREALTQLDAKVEQMLDDFHHVAA